MSCLSAVPSVVVTEYDYDKDNAVMSPYVHTLIILYIIKMEEGVETLMMQQLDMTSSNLAFIRAEQRVCV